MLLKIFSGDVGKTTVKRVLENYQKNVFSSVPFKKFELSNPPTYNYWKTDSTASISFVCFENFKIGLKASVVESNRNVWVLSRNLARVWYVLKSSSPRNFETPLLTGVQAYSIEFGRF